MYLFSRLLPPTPFSLQPQHWLFLSRYTEDKGAILVVFNKCAREYLGLLKCERNKGKLTQRGVKSYGETRCCIANT